MKDWSDFDIVLTGSGINVKTQCPQCSHTRKHSKEKCLSVNTIEGCWKCHHCNWVGSLRSGEERKSRPMDWKPQVYRRPVFKKDDHLSDDLLAFFESRGIHETVLQDYAIKLDEAYFPQLEQWVPAIVFPYYRGTEVINCKYRALMEKTFKQEFDAEKILYGLNDLTGDTAIFVEGEIDKLAFAEAGLRHCVSVPDGAPAANAKPTEKKFEYLTNCQDVLAPLTKIILAVDNDAPGKALEAELGRRLGPERCWRVQWPEGCKDANDVLLREGPSALREVIERAKPWPIDQVVFARDIAEDLLLMRHSPIPRGWSTGWSKLDECYTVKPGELTVITGMPSHGKSEWLDALLVNLAKLHGWRFFVCSPENLPVRQHASKLIEKQQREGFFSLSDAQIVTGSQFLEEHFSFLSPDDPLAITEVLKRAKAMLFQYGINGLILDPWNEFDHSRTFGQSETEHISVALGQLRRFARLHDVHVWVVAHPAKLQAKDDGTYPVARPYDISGSAHWYNRADNCLSIWRDVGDTDNRITTVHVQKVRSKYVGMVGQTFLRYDKETGTYESLMPPLSPLLQDDES